MRSRIGEYLVRAGLLAEGDLRAALAEHQRTGERLGLVLVRMNVATEKHIAQALAVQLGFPFADLVEHPPDPGAVLLIPREISLKRVCVAVGFEKDGLTVAMSDPLLFSLVQDLELQTGYRIRQVVATRRDILGVIEGAYAERAPTPAGADLSERPSGARAAGTDIAGAGTSMPTVDLVELIVRGAIISGASDVHVEPMETRVLIRHRLDGLLKEALELPRSVHEELIARFKTLAGMDVGEQRLPQSGRLRSTAEDGADIDFRVSTLRTLFGEKIVMRLLDRRKDVPALEDSGMSPAALEEMRRWLQRPHGMILVVGPTGSGRTTTLSSVVSEIQSERTNIMTIEDPVDYQIPGVNQTQIDETIALTFASGLRSILLQDPDVILLGEVRDAETARTAVHAAQADHLVLSALDADDAPSSVTRLIAFGVEAQAIASAVVGVVAQRLVRRLCARCRRPYTPPADILRSLNLSEADAAAIPFYKPVGCDQCSHTGYRGRIGIFQVMRITEALQRLIASRAPENHVRGAALAGGMVTLGEDGLAKVTSGVTTAEELLRVVTDVGEMRTLCQVCGVAVSVDFLACPQCGTRLGRGCPHCGRALQPGWHFCPYCARPVEGGRAAPQPRGREAPESPRRRPRSNVTEFKKVD